MNALIIEDDPGTVQIYRGLLRKEQFEAEVFDQPQMAIDYLKSNLLRPELVICDLELPELDGFFISQNLRPLFWLQEAYLLMVSVRQDRASLLRALDEGFNAFLKKPIDPLEFRAHCQIARKMAELHRRTEASFFQQNRALRANAEKQLRSFIHEVNTPLTVVLQRAQKLDAITKSDQMQFDVSIAAQWGPLMRNLQMLRRLFETQIAHLRKLKLTQRNGFFANEMLQDVVSIFLERAEKEAINFDWQNLAEKSAKIQAVQSEIEEVLINLISNAFDAVSKQDVSELEEEIRPLVRLNVNLDGEFLVMEVIDNGPGFKEDQWVSFFKPYHTTKPEGTGLGLFISRQIIEGYSGSLSYSRKGELSVFEVRVPVELVIGDPKE